MKRLVRRLGTFLSISLFVSFCPLSGGAISAFGEESSCNFIHGTENDDTIFGTNGCDEIHAARGTDYVAARDFGDIVYGEKGGDELHGEDGNDDVFGDSQSDENHGERGGDFIDGGEDNDLNKGGNGDDTVWDRAGSTTANDVDYLCGEDGDDDIDSRDSDGWDTIWPDGSGADVIHKDVNDQIVGGFPCGVH